MHGEGRPREEEDRNAARAEKTAPKKTKRPTRQVEEPVAPATNVSKVPFDSEAIQGAEQLKCAVWNPARAARI